ncbi:MAG: URC4/urg3 family protein [Pseudomonadota bacterium]
MTDADAAAVRALLTAGAVRDRAQTVLAAGLADNLDHFRIDMDRMGPAADIVAEVTRAAYPDLAIPFHARWRHIETGGLDRWGAIADGLATDDPRRYGRAAFDLAIVSVLLDAGAGADWAFRESASGQTFSRSEGLAVASVDMFRSGLFSGVPADPFRVDAAALVTLNADDLASGFQIDAGNPMVGLDGRCRLLQTLGATIAARPDLFALEDDPRPGGLFDALVARTSEDGRLPAAEILDTVLDGLGSIWPGGIERAGMPLGDTWPCATIVTDDCTSGLMPFHKLSQWLSYSLIEPLQWTGIEVTNIDALTGLAEYRNGGLFLDTGVLVLRDDRAADASYAPGDALIVEWRALTVALLDAIADPVRQRLGVAAADCPLARILEGGTWAAGRKLARERRPGGEPPLKLDSDGTVF